LWVGVFLSSCSTFTNAQWVSGISPIFVTLLLTKVSGVPPLERRADEKWGGNPEYEEYKATTSVLIPYPPIKKRTGSRTANNEGSHVDKFEGSSENYVKIAE
jgi:steroid 5-alpha reductase family enzyme